MQEKLPEDGHEVGELQTVLEESDERAKENTSRSSSYRVDERRRKA